MMGCSGLGCPTVRPSDRPTPARRAGHWGLSFAIDWAIMHLPRLVGRLALVLLASAFAAPPVSAQLVRRDTTPDPEVASVEFAGATKAIDLRELQANIYTGPTACRFFSFVCRVTNWRALEIRHYLNRTELKRDVLRVRVFYYREGFREAQVDTVVTRFNEKQVAVRFNIVEGPPTIVTDVAIVYDSTLMTPKRVKQLNQVMVGRPLDLFEMDSTRLQFQNELWELGYADALVDTSTVVDQPSHTARVQFRLVKNHLTTVGDVVILGTNQVSERTVLNSLSFRTGIAAARCSRASGTCTSRTCSSSRPSMYRRRSIA
jgi:hypothetical protein